MNKILGRYGVLFLIVVAGGVNSQPKTAGSVNYQHLLFNYDARSAGMGGANVALPSGVEGVLVNPSAIASIGRRQAFIGHQPILDGVWCAPLGYLQPFDFGNMAVSLQGLGSGDVQQIDEINSDPVITGKVAHVEYFTPSISYGRSFLQRKLLVGISVKGMYTRIVVPWTTYSSKGIGIDAGVQYRINSDRLIAGMVFRNVGFEFSSFTDDKSYPTPLVFEAGISYIPRYLHNMRISADVNKTRGEYISLEPGIEIEVYPKTLFLRLGYPFSLRDLEAQLNKFSGDDEEGYEKSNWSTFAFGLGVRAPVSNFNLQFDLGLQFRDNVDNPGLIYSAVVEF